MKERLKIYLPLFVTLALGSIFLAIGNEGIRDRTGSSSENITMENAISIPVLLYHGEGTNPGDVPIDEFENHMRALKKEGWQTITMKDFYGFMKEGKTVPEKSFLLTFDDGRKDSYYPADPVLRDLGYNAVMFVVTGFAFAEPGEYGNFYLNTEEIKRMIETGRWEIESHGDRDHLPYDVRTLDNPPKTVKGHFLSNKFTVRNRLENDSEFRARIRKEFVDSKQDLEKTFNIKITSFAYPFNDFGQNTINFPNARQVLSEITPTIYTFGFYQTWPGNGSSFNYPNPQEFMIKRIEPRPDWKAKDVINALAMGRHKELPYNSGKFGSEWVETWGEVEPAGSRLRIKALEETGGATTLLNGSVGWKDYSYTTVLDWKGGGEVVLIARHYDAGNYLGCAFSDGRVFIQKYENGKQEMVAETYYPPIRDKENSKFTMIVRGPTASCYYEDTPMITATSTNPALQSGGIGLQVWDKVPGVASAELKSVEVTPI